MDEKSVTKEEMSLKALKNDDDVIYVQFPKGIMISDLPTGIYIENGELITSFIDDTNTQFDIKTKQDALHVYNYCRSHAHPPLNSSKWLRLSEILK